MKNIILAMVSLHGLIHLLGFVKGLGLKEVSALTLPISKPQGLFWLFACVLFLIFAVLYFLNSRLAWLVGLLALGISQTLIMLCWTNARFGTVPNLVVLMICLFSWATFHFQDSILEETRNLMAGKGNWVQNRLLEESDLSTLPEPVKNWLQKSGSVGKPVIRAGKAIQTAEMQMKPGQENWMKAKAVQYSDLENPAFIWSVEAKMFE